MSSIAVALLVIGMAQAALLALALRLRRENASANTLLSVFMALLAFHLGVMAWHAQAPTSGVFKLRGIVSFFPFLYGSLFYLYIRALATGQRLGWRDLWHAGGLLVVLAASAWVLAQGEQATANLRADMLAGRAPLLLRYTDIGIFAYSLPYVVAGLLLCQRHRRNLLQRRADADRHSLWWVAAMAVGQLLIWGVALVNSWVSLPGGSATVFAVVALWVCALGYLSLTQSPVEPLPGGAPVTPRDADVPDPRATEVIEKLARLMEQQALYREPALTIGQLAKRSGYPEYLVSEVINRQLGGNFWEYINRLRIDAVRIALADPADARSILEIAYAVGFTSKSTFNAAFKRQLGQTPTAYRQAARETAPGATTLRTPAG
jgi:AraC-like DNA-binding protein